jgi:hypothetical protein
MRPCTKDIEKIYDFRLHEALRHGFLPWWLGIEEAKLTRPNSLPLTRLALSAIPKLKAGTQYMCQAGLLYQWLAAERQRDTQRRLRISSPEALGEPRYARLLYCRIPDAVFPGFGSGGSANGGIAAPLYPSGQRQSWNSALKSIAELFSESEVSAATR